MTTPTPSELSRKAGISPAYASMILSGARRPPLALAVHVFRATGWRHAMIAPLSDDEIAAVERVDPWTPRAAPGEAADAAIADEARHGRDPAAPGAALSTGQSGTMSGEVAA